MSWSSSHAQQLFTTEDTVHHRALVAHRHLSGTCFWSISVICPSPRQGYTIHADGKLHCVVRYRQLSCLHDQLKRVFGARALPTFPPKKLLHLNSEEVEERRLLLERYLQLGTAADSDAGAARQAFV